MDYGIWLTAAHGIGHARTLRGPFDMAMSYFFYAPNLVLAELFIRAPKIRLYWAWQASSAILLNASSVFAAVASYCFLRYYWRPAIVHRLF
jgi:hypothetical protein